MTKTKFILLLSLLIIGCIHQKNTSLEKQVSENVFLAPQYYNRNNPSDSSIIWIPISYTLKNFDPNNTKAILSSVANKHQLLYNIIDYNLFNDHTFQKEWITINNSKISNTFFFVSNHIKLSNKDLQNAVKYSENKSLINPIPIIRTKKINSEILKQIKALNNREDTIYLRLINEKGKTLQILKDKIDYN